MEDNQEITLPTTSMGCSGIALVAQAAVPPPTPFSTFPSLSLHHSLQHHGAAPQLHTVARAPAHSARAGLPPHPTPTPPSRTMQVPTFSMSSGLTLEDFGWGTPTFHKMGREKINLIYAFTKMGFDVLISDVDTVWLRNPLPYMAQARRCFPVFIFVILCLMRSISLHGMVW